MSAGSYPPSSGVDDAEIAVPLDLSEAESQILARADAIIGELNVLKGQIDGLHGTWDGAAAADYHVLQSEWNTAAQGLFGADGAPGVLGEIAQAMGVAAANYYDAEHANIATWTNSG
jgi:WXG100 family type VII secretion target